MPRVKPNPLRHPGSATSKSAVRRSPPSRALVFPGQGSQSVGMGCDLAATFPVAREVFEEVDQALGKPLFRLMAEGPEDELTLTQNAQPALMALSLAVLRVLDAEFGITLPRMGSLVAGHSLGEYTALTAAGSFGIGDAARLLRIRGDAMRYAVPTGHGAMAALMGIDLQAAGEIVEEATRCSYHGAVCATSNDNAPGQVVISGTRAAVELALEIANSRGARRAVLLPVSGPFHCSLMAPVAEVMEEALSKVDVAPPVVPLVSNITAREVVDPDEIRTLLVRQVTEMVRWRESIVHMRSVGIRELVEIGNGKVLAGLAKRIDRTLMGTAVSTPAEIRAFADGFAVKFA